MQHRRRVDSFSSVHRVELTSFTRRQSRFSRLAAEGETPQLRFFGSVSAAATTVTCTITCTYSGGVGQSVARAQVTYTAVQQHDDRNPDAGCDTHHPRPPARQRSYSARPPAASAPGPVLAGAVVMAHWTTYCYCCSARWAYDALSLVPRMWPCNPSVRPRKPILGRASGDSGESSLPKAFLVGNASLSLSEAADSATGAETYLLAA